MAAPTDFGTLVRVLTDVGVIGTAVAKLDPKIEHRDKLVQHAGGILSAEEADQLLHIGCHAVDKRRRNKNVARRSPRRGLVLPRGAVP
jgi:hypothetical protein